MTFEETLILKDDLKSQTSFNQAKELYDAIINSPDGDVVEVGSAYGGTTIVLIGASEIREKNVFSIDPYPKELEGTFSDYGQYPIGICDELKTFFSENILNGKYNNIVQFNEDTSDCINKIPNKLSVVFIDGLHKLESVKNEIKLLLPKITTNGFLYLHDIKTIPEIVTWLENYDVKNIQILHGMLRCEKI